MCVLTYIPAGVDIPWDGLANGGCANPDGHGWAIAKGDRLIIGKSMDLFTALDDYEKAMLDLPGAVSIFHSRIATAGTVNEYNVHPFYVGGTDHSIVAHNGILPARWQPVWGNKSDLRSDTRLFADTMGHVIDNARGVPSRRIGQRLGHMIGTYNKLVFMSVKSGAPVVRIINAQMGVWVDGVWHSNYSFEAWKPKYKPLTPSKWATSGDKDWPTTKSGEYKAVDWREPYDWEGERQEDCSLCKGSSIDPGGYCMDCTQCQDCLALEVNCSCYIPRSSVGGKPVDEAQAWLEAREAEIAALKWQEEQDDRDWEAFIERQKEREVIVLPGQPVGPARQIEAARQEPEREFVRVESSPTTVEFRAPQHQD